MTVAGAVAQADIRAAPVARDTLQERVYNRLASLILDGDIPPGRLVTIQSLAEAFGVSAMPVREALKRLTASNALTVVSGRSIGVPPITLERFTDLRNVRREIEGAATAWAAKRIDADSLASLEHDLVRMDQAIASGETTAYLRANRSFHFTIYRASGSPVSVALIESLWLQISPYFNLLQGSGNYVSANSSHRIAAEALGARRRGFGESGDKGRYRPRVRCPGLDAGLRPKGRVQSVPGATSRSSQPGSISGSGMASMRSWVYRLFGAAKTSSQRPSSTIRPAFMT